LLVREKLLGKRSLRTKNPVYIENKKEGAIDNSGSGEKHISLSASLMESIKAKRVKKREIALEIMTSTNKMEERLEGNLNKRRLDVVRAPDVLSRIHQSLQIRAFQPD